ncbi:MAG: DNA-binding protein [Candidatus Magasanikbacteria bacterium]|nr:DNA-binding protein [Candidatus Magasanikbacteria bacterium]
MNKAQLAQTIADKVGTSKKEAEDMVQAYVEIVINTLKSGGEVNIAGFGAFSAKTRAGRIGVNPQNPSEKIQIPPVTVPKFKAGKRLKDALKEKKPEDNSSQDNDESQTQDNESGMGMGM